MSCLYCNNEGQVLQYMQEFSFEPKKIILPIFLSYCLIVELKACEWIIPEHEAQLVNYLRATELEVGMLLNFGKDPQFKRRVLSNEYK